MAKMWALVVRGSVGWWRCCWSTATRSCPSDRLSEAVFAGEPTPGAQTTLRSYVARLRKVVDGNGSGSRVVTQAPGYMLEVLDDAFDVARFERLVAEGRSRLAHDDAVAASSALREALALWRGEAYAEFADEDWAPSGGAASGGAASRRPRAIWSTPSWRAAAPRR